MSRQLRSVLLVTSDQLDHRVPNRVNIKTEMTHVKQRLKFYFDKRAKELKPLTVGEGIRVRLGKHWKPAIVNSKIMRGVFDALHPNSSCNLFVVLTTTNCATLR